MRNPAPSLRMSAVGQALACLLAAAMPPGAAASDGASAASRPDVVLVSLDTTRRDRVSCYGAPRLTTPTIDALAASGVLFADCQAVIPVTGPSHASMLTGLYPQTHGAFRNGVPMGEGPRTLPAVLRDAGWRTAAFVAGWTLKARQCGLARGFDRYDEDGMEDRYGVVNLMRRADRVTDAALAWLDADLAAAAAGGTPRPPYFLLVHYFDPHEPYQSPIRDTPPPNPAARATPRRARAEAALEAYDREIAWTDQQLGRLLAGLRERGLGQALVIVTADHGQAFGEHGETGHGRQLYQSTLAVPLVVAWPDRLPVGRTVDLPTSHLDLLPTLGSLLGLPAEAMPLGVQGVDLARCVLDPDAAAPWGNAQRLRHAVAFPGAVGNKWNIFRWAQNKQVDRAMPVRVAAVIDRHKVIVDPRRPHRVEVYDLAADPTEVGEVPDAAARFASHAPRLLAWFDRTRIDLRDVEPSAADLEALRALGYVE